MVDLLMGEDDPGSPGVFRFPELLHEALGLLLTHLSRILCLLLAKQKGLSNNFVMLAVIANQDKRGRIRVLVLRRFIDVNTSHAAWIIKVASFFVEKFQFLPML